MTPSNDCVEDIVLCTSKLVVEFSTYWLYIHAYDIQDWTGKRTQEDPLYVYILISVCLCGKSAISYASKFSQTYSKLLNWALKLRKWLEQNILELKLCNSLDMVSLCLFICQCVARVNLALNFCLCITYF